MDSKIRNHMDKYKYVYLSAGLIVAGVIVVRHIPRTPSILNNNSPVINVMSNNVDFGGYSRKLVKCLETGEIWETVKDAAASAGVSPTMMSKHVNGHKDHISNRHYRIVGLGSGA